LIEVLDGGALSSPERFTLQPSLCPAISLSPTEAISFKVQKMAAGASGSKECHDRLALSLLFAARRLMLELTGRAFNAPSIQADE
jgi:hypothetical protein